ncbi:MAG: hypothetical protein Q8S19_02035 [Bacillota bacterium]|nr:hypothetical protein [Bacillota bacterium]
MDKPTKISSKREFMDEEIAIELHSTLHLTHPREARSQKAQLGSVHQHGTRKDKKLKYHKKIT